MIGKHIYHYLSQYMLKIASEWLHISSEIDVIHIFLKDIWQRWVFTPLY